MIAKGRFNLSKIGIGEDRVVNGTEVKGIPYIMKWMINNPARKSLLNLVNKMLQCVAKCSIIKERR